MMRYRVTVRPARSLALRFPGSSPPLVLNTVPTVEARLLPVLRGDPGPSGAAAAAFVHTQSVAAADWIVNHNLGVQPTVSVTDAGGNVVLAEVQHVSTAQARVRFALAVAGVARCH